MKIFTIGVYNSSEQQFFDKLIANNIVNFCDIRRRRGVRGKKYSFVNSLRLQKKIMELDINYFHFLDLSPTNDIREAQKLEDKKKNVLKSKREHLGEVFSQLYQKNHLTIKNINHFNSLINIEFENTVLFCVEEKPQACHRYLFVQHLAVNNPQIEIIHL